jgi:hypothetical protein
VTRIGASLLVGLFLIWPSVAAAQPRCQFATGGDGLAVTIAMRGTAGLRLRIEWGDGTTESVRRLDEARERGYIRHEYAAAGRYTIRAEAREPTGGGCRLEAELDVPYPTPKDEDSQTLLPSAGAPPDEPDDEPPPLPTVAPRATRPTDRPPPSLLAQALEALGRAIGALGDWLWGRR